MGGLSWLDLILGKPLDLQIQFILGSTRQKVVPSKIKTSWYHHKGRVCCVFFFLVDSHFLQIREMFVHTVKTGQKSKDTN